VALIFIKLINTLMFKKVSFHTINYMSSLALISCVIGTSSDQFRDDVTYVQYYPVPVPYLACICFISMSFPLINVFICTSSVLQVYFYLKYFLYSRVL